jgi:dTDP-4-amino-4,6-dideoxygalactose transaminase
MVDVKLIDKNVIPFKSTLTETQGALGSNLLDKLGEFTFKRRKLSKEIREKLNVCINLEFQKFEIESSHSHHLLPARCISSKWNRDDLIKILYEKYKIKCVIQYYPLNRYDLFKNLCCEQNSLIETDSFFDNMISFPFSITLSSEQIKYLTSSIIEAIEILEK